MGVIAQEIKQIEEISSFVLPFTYEERDDDNNLISSEDYLSVDEKPIKYMLVNAVLEQQEVIEAQNEVIESLEERILRLEKIVGNSTGGVGVNQ